MMKMKKSMLETLCVDLTAQEDEEIHVGDALHGPDRVGIIQA